MCFEGDWPFFEAANAYINGKRATPFPLDGEGGRFPKWMWHNQVMAELFDWLKKRRGKERARVGDGEKGEGKDDCDGGGGGSSSSSSSSGGGGGGVFLAGIDCYSLFESKRSLLAFLHEHDPEFCSEVTDRLAFIDKYTTAHEYGEAMVYGGLKRVQGHLQDVLTKIQARLQWGSDKYNCTDLERLAAEQNCEVVIAADEYYRKCISEPRGSRASWNTRDQHMATTLLRIQGRLGDPKCVVWAHNSHVGDSIATRRGGVSFERNEKWNLGQMVRATFGKDKTWIVGQYTNDGTVTAAHEWGGKHESRALRRAIPESYEAAMHELQRELGLTSAGEATEANPARSFCFNTRPFAAARNAIGNATMEVDSEGEGKGETVGVDGGGGGGDDDDDPACRAVMSALRAGRPGAASLVSMLTNAGEEEAEGGEKRKEGGAASLGLSWKQQRWVGVCYKPETEMQSHYGEVCLVSCYDQVVFVDRSEALRPVKPREQLSFDKTEAGSSRYVCSVLSCSVLSCHVMFSYVPF